MAKNDELLARLNDKEDNFIERKPNGAKRDELRRTLVAFANSVPDGQTAVLYVGVLSDGLIQGVGGIDSLQKTIRDICERDCYPPIKFASYSLTQHERDVLAVEVPHSVQRPHFAGPAFVRVGSESKAATQELYEELLTSHCSDAGQLLKVKNQLVTVWAIKKVLGNPRPVPSETFSREYECQIVAVTPTSVSLVDIASNNNYSEPIGNIELTKDESKHRPMLIVRLK